MSKERLKGMSPEKPGYEPVKVMTKIARVPRLLLNLCSFLQNAREVVMILDSTYLLAGCP